MSCAFCDGDGGRVVLRTDHWRLVHAGEADFPAFYRLVWNRHVREFSELPVDQRHACVDALAAIEQVLIAQLQPTKVNVASLGNAVPHLHWHVIARFDWDSHFPAPVWSTAQRQGDAGKLQAVAARLPQVEEQLRAVFTDRGA
ncbi:MAG TPA: HIT family protein [Ramlibacter sp.]|nr:HIT family protein [Ramlibacter sp.]